MDEVVVGKRAGKQTADAAERTRHAIVDAALPLFAERGFDGVGLRDIAERAGTTHGLLRHHFGSKEGVWRAVVDTADVEYATSLKPLLTNAREVDDDAAATLATVARGIIRVSVRHPAIVQLLVYEGARGGERLDYILERIAPLRAEVAPLLTRVQQLGLLCQFTPDSFFLFLLSVAAMPFALTALTDRLLGLDIADTRGDLYADQLVATLFGESISPSKVRSRLA